MKNNLKTKKAGRPRYNKYDERYADRYDERYAERYADRYADNYDSYPNTDYHTRYRKHYEREKNKKKTLKLLKTHIENHILKQKDICCEEHFEREDIINKIIELYTKLYQSKEEINNHIIYDIKRLVLNRLTSFKLSDNIDKYTQTLKHTIKLLKVLPLYLLLSLLGVAYINSN
jgi:hypothetical protein